MVYKFISFVLCFIVVFGNVVQMIHSSDGAEKCKSVNFKQFFSALFCQTHIIRQWTIGQLVMKILNLCKLVDNS